MVLLYYCVGSVSWGDLDHEVIRTIHDCRVYSHLSTLSTCTCTMKIEAGLPYFLRELLALRLQDQGSSLPV